MKLPLDNFQILGASPGSSARNILMILERKLENCPYSGFSQRTLQLRGELLKQYSTPLIDIEKRKVLDSFYQIQDSADEEKRFIILPSGSEIPGLLLLLESGSCDECFNIANDLLSNKLNETSADSSELAELYLIIGYATLEYARVLRSKRYYENCARILEKGLSTVNSNIDNNSINQALNKELEDIIPFRILDLLSRDMDQPIRTLGIKFLDDFVIRRGGLDGDSTYCMKNDEFKAFFRQIRYFLTVQEQIDLYQLWCRNGSDSACFLLSISLVASGFARRKPERLVQAQEILKKLNSEELKKINACISLLLGTIDFNDRLNFPSNQNEENTNKLSQEAALGELCDDCREWLESDILEGYRDLEADPDLEAYFSDRDVTTFIENRDSQLRNDKNINKNFLDPFELGNKRLQKSANFKQLKTDEPNRTISAVPFSENKNLEGKAENQRIILNKWAIAACLLVLAITSWAVFIRRNEVKRNAHSQVRNTSVYSNVNKKGSSAHTSIQDTQVKTTKPALELYPNNLEVQSILTQWLQDKSRVLAGFTLPSRISRIATSDAVKRLQSERKQDKLNGERMLMAVKILDLYILNRKPNRIEVIATLRYSDTRLDAQNRVIEKTPEHVFKKTYILVKMGSGWLVQ